MKLDDKTPSKILFDSAVCNERLYLATVKSLKALRCYFGQKYIAYCFVQTSMKLLCHSNLSHGNVVELTKNIRSISVKEVDVKR